MSPDPLFTVRVLADSGTDWVAITIPVVASLAGLWIGGLVTYRATRKAEKERFAEETKMLALSIKVEVSAARDILEKTIERLTALPMDFHIDTAIHGEAITDPLPITKATAGMVGRFDASVARLISALLADIASVMQGNRMIRTMAERGALTPDKLGVRQQAIRPFIDDMRQHADELITEIRRVYGPSDGSGREP